MPDAIIGFEHDEISYIFTHDAISSTFTEVIEVSDRRPALETIYKQPSEKYPVSADFVNVLAADETLVIGSCSVTVVDVAGVDVTTDMVQGLSVQDVTRLKTTLKAAGTEAASPYKITFIGVTDQGHTYEIDGKIRVVDL